MSEIPARFAIFSNFITVRHKFVPFLAKIRCRKAKDDSVTFILEISILFVMINRLRKKVRTIIVKVNTRAAVISPTN